MSLPDLEVSRQPPAELHQTMVEQRHPRFQAHPHAGPVDLGKQIVREVAGLIGQHHSLDEFQPTVGSLEEHVTSLGSLLTTLDQRTRLVPGG